MRTSLLLLLFCILLSGCDNLLQNGEAENLPPLIVPEDQATEVEREAIEQTLKQITKYTKQWGKDMDYHRLPIILRVRDNPSENVAGRCHYDYDMNGHYIEVFKDVVPVGVVRRDKNFSSELFIVLLHEIGHCYYNRAHENKLIKRDGYEFVFPLPDESISGEVYFPELPATIMVDTWSVGIPRSLEKYYVGEVLGVVRANTPEELQKFARFDIRRVGHDAGVNLPNEPVTTPDEPAEPQPAPQPEPQQPPRHHPRHPEPQATPSPEPSQGPSSPWQPPWETSPGTGDPNTGGGGGQVVQRPYYSISAEELFGNKKGIRFCSDP
jgi:hypothetical protein